MDPPDSEEAEWRVGRGAGKARTGESGHKTIFVSGADDDGGSDSQEGEGKPHPLKFHPGIYECYMDTFRGSESEASIPFHQVIRIRENTNWKLGWRERHKFC